MSGLGSRRRVALALAGAISFVLFFGTGAYAGSVFSDIGYYTVNGVQYENRALISTNTSYHTASARTDIAGYSQTIPAGEMAALGRLFKSNGDLSCAGTYQYSSAPLGAGVWQPGYSCSRTSVGAWFSKGTTKAWNGSNAYVWWYTYQTVNQNS